MWDRLADLSAPDLKSINLIIKPRTINQTSQHISRLRSCMVPNGRQHDNPPTCQQGMDVKYSRKISHVCRNQKTKPDQWPTHCFPKRHLRRAITLAPPPTMTKRRTSFSYLASKHHTSRTITVFPQSLPLAHHNSIYRKKVHPYRRTEDSAMEYGIYYTC
jgi:hypothetical protein